METRSSAVVPAGVDSRLWEIGDIVTMIEDWEANDCITTKAGAS
jgi:hypothetical protein